MPQKYKVETTAPPDGIERFWTLDLAMLCLGTTLAWIIFKFLRFDDPRILYNAWTYLLLVPTALVAMSLAFRFLVGKFVEKSMQLAFLLSVTLHLMLLLAAVNVVIFARWWPDVFESISFQPPNPEREAPNYLSVSSPRSKSKPDYFKPAATQHEASEASPTVDAMMELAKIEKADLPSLTAEVEKSSMAALMEKANPVPTTPEQSLAETKRSRSEAETQKMQSRQVDLPDVVPDNSQPAPSLSARDDAMERQEVARSETALSQPSPAAELDRPLTSSASASIAPRAETEMLMPASDSAAAQSLERQAITKSLRASDQSIDVPRSQEAVTAPSVIAPRSDSAERRNPSSNTIAALANSLPLQNSPKPQSAPVPASMQRRDMPAGLPEIVPGDAADQPRQKTAGGGLDAPSSATFPVAGPTAPATSQAASDTAGNSPSLESSLTGNSEVRRSSSATGSNSTAMATLSEPAAFRSTIGKQGTGLTKASDDRLVGNALANDTASLAGSETSPIARSAFEMRTPGSANTEVKLSGLGESESAEDGSAGNNADGGSGTPDGISARETQLAGRTTTTDGDSTAQNVSMLGMSGDIERPAGLPNAPKLSRSGVGRDGRDSLAESLVSKPGEVMAGGMERDTSAQRPAREAKPIEAIAGEGNGQASGDSSVGEALEPRSVDDEVGPMALNRSGGLDLPIEAELGAGGISAAGDPLASSLMARPVPNIEQAPSELLTQRFLRSDVGGLRAGGSSVPIPKPAFQQRIDRAAQAESDSDPGPLGPETEEAIERGLQFLARTQRPDGSWRLQDYDTKVLVRSTTAATALSVLAFQGAGYTHRQHKYANTINKALEFLIQNQKASGDLYITQDPASDQNAWLYSHSIASLALCEAYGMTQDEALKVPAQKAVDFMVAAQDPERGGWRYRPGRGTDTSVTGWFMMALQSAKLSGLDVPDSTRKGIEKWLVSSQASEDESHLYRYNPNASNTPTQRHGLIPNPTMTSVGLLMRLYTGWHRDHPSMVKGAEYLMDYLPESGTSEQPRRDTYYWYYATQVLFHMGGEYWEKWNGRLHPLLLKSQVLEGDLAGSWEPLGEVPDLWGRYGGRLYVTTMNLLSLEVYYRHLPLYDATAK